MGGSGEKYMLYNCAKKEETHHTSAYLEHTTHTQPGHITVRARGREGGQQARSRSAQMSRRRASGNGAARRQLEDGGSRGSGSKTARGPRRRGPRRRERLRRRRRVQQLRAAAMLRVASAFAKTTNRKNSSCSRSRGRRVSAVSTSSRPASRRQHSLSAAIMHGGSPGNGMQHRRACCRSMARHGSRLACHGCARSKGALSGPLLRS